MAMATDANANRSPAEVKVPMPVKLILIATALAPNMMQSKTRPSTVQGVKISLREGFTGIISLALHMMVVANGVASEQKQVLNQILIGVKKPAVKIKSGVVGKD
jgi:hypothetical protein